MKITSQTAPWKKKKPKKGAPKKLTEAEKKLARSRAEENGRRYPNLVDNMWVLKQREK
jgi:hypothetical protein